jgi:hypothetical protein
MSTLLLDDLATGTGILSNALAENDYSKAVTNSFYVRSYG